MKKGFILITVLAIVIVLALGIATLLKSVASQTDMKANNLREIQAKYLAEAGMQYALWVCRTHNGDCSTAAGTLATATTGFAYPVVISLSGNQITVRVDYPDL